MWAQRKVKLSRRNDWSSDFSHLGEVQMANAKEIIFWVYKVNIYFLRYRINNNTNIKLTYFQVTSRFNTRFKSRILLFNN